MRFRTPWRWDGQPVVLLSRAWDEAGNGQPMRSGLRGRPRPERASRSPTRSRSSNQHYNSITSWGIDSKGGIKHVYV